MYMPIRHWQNSFTMIWRISLVLLGHDAGDHLILTAVSSMKKIFLHGSFTESIEMRLQFLSMIVVRKAFSGV